MIRIALLLLVLAGSQAAVAATTACPEQFARGQAPTLLNQRMADRTVPICFLAFAVLHSGATRTPLYSAERLTTERLTSARETPRQGQFHPEDQLPPADRAELADYARSGYDRGHMSPSGDMPDEAAQQQSFSLANMVPQNGPLNRGLWEGIESATRTYAMQRGLLFVVTGPAFRATELASVGNVLVPTHVWKAILDPARGTAAAYVAVNDASGAWQVMSMAELAAFTGIEVFPGMDAGARSHAMQLPAPTPHNRQSDGRQSDSRQSDGRQSDYRQMGNRQSEYGRRRGERF